MGDDIAWMKFGSDGRLYAINPENGFFGVAPGTSEESNENAMKMLSKNTIFTNVAETPEGDIWWEGMTKTKPQKLTDWKGNDWNPSMKEKAAHGNSRFCVPIQQCPVLDANFEKSNGVPIDAILFGGRRDTTIPLVFQSYNWNHGVLVGASISSEQTEAAEGRGVRHDPFAMLPFCGYNMADYFNHWVQMKSKTQEEKLPKIFQVNWFKKDSKGDFLWPGFAENSRVLKWVFERTNGEGKAIETPIGWIPEKIDTEGIQIEKENMEKLFEIDSKEWTNEINEVSNYLNKTFGDKLPKELNEELKKIQKRISN
jgi:phosphoenolpyruvate carboxykinase (GTP)